MGQLILGALSLGSFTPFLTSRYLTPAWCPAKWECHFMLAKTPIAFLKFFFHGAKNSSKPRTNLKIPEAFDTQQSLRYPTALERTLRQHTNGRQNALCRSRRLCSQAVCSTTRRAIMYKMAAVHLRKTSPEQDLLPLVAHAKSLATWHPTISSSNISPRVCKVGARQQHRC
eukprot:jgi/Botrbrau1/8967/Bobra.0148s0078.1